MESKYFEFPKTWLNGYYENFTLKEIKECWQLCEIDNTCNAITFKDSGNTCYFYRGDLSNWSNADGVTTLVKRNGLKKG